MRVSLRTVLCKIRKVTIQPTEPSILFGPPYFSFHISSVSGLLYCFPSDLRQLSQYFISQVLTVVTPPVLNPSPLASVFHKKLKACLFYLSFLPWPLYYLDNTCTEISFTDLAIEEKGRVTVTMEENKN